MGESVDGVMEQVARSVRDSGSAGRRALIGRVIDLKGFSTLPADEMVVIEEDGTLHGQLLGRPGAAKLTAAAPGLMEGEPRLATVGVEIAGPAVEELGLSCGGRADVLLQPAASIPDAFWNAMAARAPAALITFIDGSAAGPDALAVGREDEWGDLDPAVSAADRALLIGEARDLLNAGRTGARRIDTGSGVALVEAWVPAPRLVVVGRGDVLAAIERQAGLLGWEVRATEAVGADGDTVDELLDWAGATAALIVCSHDPEVDSRALATGLGRAVPYVGAMGSRSTQSRRLAQLAADGVPEEQAARIHQPIGLDLGGCRPSEVALAIVAEIVACHCGRDGRSLTGTTGPIHG